MFLAVGAIAAGWVGIPPVFMEHGDRIGEFLAPVLGHAGGHGTHAQEYFVIAASVFVAVGGWIIAHIMYIKKTDLPQRLGSMFKPVHTLLYNKYWIDELYSKTLVQPTLKVADKVVLGFFDRIIIEGIVNGVPALIAGFSQGFRRIQTGLLANYGLVMALGALCFIGYLILMG